MIALPVLAITAADVVMHTQDVRGTESLDRRLGAASAFVQAQQGAGHILQGADPEGPSGSDGASGVPLVTAAQVSSALGGASSSRPGAATSGSRAATASPSPRAPSSTSGTRW